MIGTYGYNCEFENDGTRILDEDTGRFRTFSIGIFQWIKKRSGKDGEVKRGRATVRVRGYTRSSEPVFAKAKLIIQELEAGTYNGPKTVDLTRKKYR